MIKRLSLTNFKCFEAADVDFAPLTLLTGVNGAGKSSIIQAFLLLKQSRNKRSILLNGEYVSLGRPSDIFYNDAIDDTMVLELTSTDSKTAKWRFQYDHTNDKFKEVGFGKSRFLDGISASNYEGLFTPNFHYLCADRWGPRTALPLSEEHVRLKKLGIHGEYVLHYLLSYGSKKLPNEAMKLHSSEKSKTLERQVQAWLSDISPGVRIDFQEFKHADFATIGFSFPSHVGMSKYFRATNVGFGLSHCLPVIVSLLSLKSGGLLLIENPESHLHPRAQTALARLMAVAASSGIQVVVETHSDHIVNGVRIAVKEGIIPPESVAINFAEIREANAMILKPKIDQDGRMDFWPDHFFDEWEKSLEKLI